MSSSAILRANVIQGTVAVKGPLIRLGDLTVKGGLAAIIL